MCVALMCCAAGCVHVWFSMAYISKPSFVGVDSSLSSDACNRSMGGPITKQPMVHRLSMMNDSSFSVCNKLITFLSGLI